MRLDFGRLFAEAADMLRRDRDVLAVVSGIFFFLPTLAFVLLTTPLAVPEGADAAATLAVMTAFIQANALSMLLVELTQLFGVLVIVQLYLDPNWPTLGGALRGAAGKFPGFAAAMLLASLAVFGGWLMLFLPGLYLAGRFFLLAPALAASAEPRIADRFAHAVTLTRGRAWLFLALTAAIYLPAQLVTLIGGGVGAGGGGAIGADIVQAVGAAIVAFAGAGQLLALGLLKVAAYRTLSAPASPR